MSDVCQPLPVDDLTAMPSGTTTIFPNDTLIVECDLPNDNTTKINIF